MTASEVSWSLRSVNRAAAELDRAFAAHLSLSPLEYTAIDHIMSSEGDPIGPVELAARIGISPGSATEMVDRLERYGHVSRERGAADRRRVLVTTRPEAVKRILGDLAPLFDELDNLADTFSPDEQRTIQSYLRQAAHLLTLHSSSMKSEEPDQGASSTR
ncbi:MarR family winged helix-turn-helix transcriptional regulator [Planococcus sp. APC 4015]|nr:MarR family winged helix-turn-helix transcriptional regulator [Planococcus sp. APC 4015]